MTARQEMMKRVIDITTSAIALGVLLPLMAIIAFLIRLDSPGPVLYLSKRVGRKGKLFTIYKFRSMYWKAPGPPRSHSADPRVTRAGSLLRHSKLDELPQLLNVLRGDMSLVGPRPEAPDFVARFSAEQRKVLEIVPGITGVAQIEFHDESENDLAVDDLEIDYHLNILPQKSALDMQYARKKSLILDGKIIARTIQAVVLRPESDR